MKTSEKIDEISKALNSAQQNVSKALKDSKNPFFKSKYADLNSVMGACQSAFNDNGISIIQGVDFNEQGHYLETRLVHESGQFFSSSMKLLVGKNDMQGLGSAITYARRYAMQSMCFVGADDDDGNANAQQFASNKTNNQKPSANIARKNAIISELKLACGKATSGMSQEQKISFMSSVLKVSDFKDLNKRTDQELKSLISEVEQIILTNGE